ncbi:Uncharacterised protein [Vibrio cholerae]|nr:Uncharacterised protein [Vibrio cholerae]CSC32515.1 Uncharacterised protein [Vibrio cholerae]CSC96825.1 Uncharacterised protein [Vibrio cholerae]CSD09853.1 Uncharacterised protein [Vibrio cholerae]CSD54203.1 Uncharacterised protein [Vibrio cholerae]
MTFADFIVVEVVRRGDFHTARAFLHIGVLIAHDWDATTDDRQNDLFTNQIFITRIFWVNRNTRIAEHGFWTGGGNHDVIFTICRFHAIG